MSPVIPTTRKISQPGDLLALGYLGLILLVAIVPASLWVPLKATAVVTVFALTILALTDRKRLTNAIGPGAVIVLSYILVVLGLTTYTLYSGSVDLSSAASAAARYIVIVLLVFAGFLSLQWKTLTASSILRAIFIGHFGYLILKIGSLLAARVMGLEAEQIAEVASTLVPGATVHGFRENEGFVRIFLGNDAITPFIVALYLSSVHRGIIPRPIWGDLFIALNLIGAALTFTRFVWLSLLVVIVVFLISYTPRVTRNQLIRALATGILSLFVVIFIVGVDGGGSVNSVQGMTSERLGDKDSIGEKRLQVTLMWKAFSGSPVAGTGVGSHLEGYDRPDALPFQYEVQWLALLMQLGIVGFLPLMLIASAPLWPILELGWPAILNRDFLFLSSSYGLWLLGAFTNPYLFILNSVLVYLGFLVMSSTAAGALTTEKNAGVTKEVCV